MGTAEDFSVPNVARSRMLQRMWRALSLDRGSLFFPDSVCRPVPTPTRHAVKARGEQQVSQIKEGEGLIMDGVAPPQRIGPRYDERASRTWLAFQTRALGSSPAVDASRM